MKKPQITPGEWIKHSSVGNFEVVPIALFQDSPENLCICAFGDIHPENRTKEHAANARAIAAVPDCLAALEQAITIFGKKNPDPLQAFAMIERMKKALEKAGYEFP